MTRFALVGLLVALAAGPATGDRKRLGKDGLCDLCGTAVKADAVVFPSAEFRTAVKNGLRPPITFLVDGKDVGEAAWLKLVEADTTGWACCEACRAKVEVRLAAAAPPRAESIWSELGADMARLPGLNYLSRGEYDKAEESLTRLLRQYEARDPDGLAAAAVLADLGMLYRHTGRYDRADALGTRALEIRERRLGPKHPDVAHSLNNLATVAMYLGQFRRAETYLDRSRAICEELKDDVQLAATLNNLGMLCAQMRRDEEAARHLERALALKVRAQGENHPTVARALDNLANVYVRLKDWERASELLTRALKIRERDGGADHPDMAVTLYSLGSMAIHLGRFDEAAGMIDRALGIARRRLGPDNPAVAQMLVGLAHTHMAGRRFAEAEPLLRESLAIRRAKLPADHPDVLASLNFLTDLYAMTGRWAEATAAADEGQRAFRAHASRVLPYLAEADQARFFGGYADNTDKVLSLGLLRPGDADAVGRSAAWLLNVKGVIQEAMSAQVTLAATQTGPDAALVGEWRAVRQDIATLSMQGGSDRGRLDDLVAREHELAGRLGRATAPDRERPWVELAVVRGRLAPDQVLVEFARVRVADFDRGRLGAARYAAWVVRRDDVRVIDLGDADRIEDAVRAARRSIRAAGPGNELAALAALVLRPLEPYVGPAATWTLSPDADLWLVPWAALPLADGRFAVEGHRISYVVSGRDLVAPPAEAATGPPVILADPDFGASGRWPRLPGTAREARAVQPGLARYGITAPRVFTGDQARESEFKSLRRPRALLLSTHGFFLSEDDDVGSPDAAVRGTYIAPARPADPRPATARPVLSDNPLLRCGLVLAGANRPDPAGDDGLLTGLEIVGTDLRGTDLVVLSACDTGLGRTRAGEGVAGLRQAFHLAGARTVVASLWQVPDDDTADLVADCVAHLAAGRSKADALRQAQLDKIADLRHRHGTAHPLLWAAFTLSGDPGVDSPAVVPEADAVDVHPEAEPGDGSLAGTALIALGCLTGVVGVGFLARRYWRPTAAPASAAGCQCNLPPRLKAAWAARRQTCPRCGKGLGSAANRASGAA